MQIHDLSIIDFIMIETFPGDFPELGLWYSEYQVLKEDVDWNMQVGWDEKKAIREALTLRT